MCSVLYQPIWLCTFLTGLPPQHGNVASLAAATYYQQNDQHSPAKYPENGHDTLSDFVTFVCQEAENAQNQVWIQCENTVIFRVQSVLRGLNSKPLFFTYCVFYFFPLKNASNLFAYKKQCFFFFLFRLDRLAALTNYHSTTRARCCLHHRHLLWLGRLLSSDRLVSVQKHMLCSFLSSLDLISSQTSIGININFIRRQFKRGSSNYGDHFLMVWIALFTLMTIRSERRTKC